jgi:hypothetical protein
MITTQTEDMWVVVTVVLSPMVFPPKEGRRGGGLCNLCGRQASQTTMWSPTRRWGPRGGRRPHVLATSRDDGRGSGMNGEGVPGWPRERHAPQDEAKRSLEESPRGWGWTESSVASASGWGRMDKAHRGLFKPIFLKCKLSILIFYLSTLRIYIRHTKGHLS